MSNDTKPIRQGEELNEANQRTSPTIVLLAWEKPILRSVVSDMPR